MGLSGSARPRSPEHLGADRKKMADVQPGERTMKRSAGVRGPNLHVNWRVKFTDRVRFKLEHHTQTCSP